MNDLIIRNVPSFANKELNKATHQMLAISETMRKSALETAAIIAHVAETQCYEEDGFSTVHEWVERTFGLKKSASYTLLKIGSEYLSEVYNSKGKIVGYVTNVADAPEAGDYSISQIEKMLPAGHDLAKKLNEDGVLSPSMTCKQIEEVVKHYTGKDEENEEDADVEAIPDGDGVDGDMDIIVTDEHGDRYAIPESVLKKYRI